MALAARRAVVEASSVVPVAALAVASEAAEVSAVEAAEVSNPAESSKLATNRETPVLSRNPTKGTEYGETIHPRTHHSNGEGQH